ncbi:tetratricopeptide repeat protein [Erythrobacter crassostreae]|uniref:Uncharacterized protein n=1 Tax=Erythrobacter crassostreae TaxID=2828328 RepID=A0A9X1F1C0_9SPHN|nr:hypothetical protein [Erythrobacter crassostrea]MBV7258507.1 hypothetical protein [Erythrobacter crassostrea]
MMKNLNIVRLILALAVGLIACLFVALQTFSMISTKAQPDTAAWLFPINGAAIERAAFDDFSQRASETGEPREAALAVREEALQALRHDPTAVKAHVLIAMAQEKGEKRDALALAASKLNRRDLALQGVMLQVYLEKDDSPRAVQTLDQILRVHPSYSADFFPILGEALRDDQGPTTFARYIDGTSPWHTDFFANYAVREEPLLANVAKLRMERELADERFDQQLIRRLAETGRAEEAQDLFFAIAGADEDTSTNGTLDWTARFPPFHWQFVDQPDLRGQASTDETQLEIYARTGNGGVIAQRIVAPPQGPFAIELALLDATAGRKESVRLRLQCPGDPAPFFVEPLDKGQNRFTFESKPNCSQMLLTIFARAFSGEPTLNASLSKITIQDN